MCSVIDSSLFLCEPTQAAVRASYWASTAVRDLKFIYGCSSQVNVRWEHWLYTLRVELGFKRDDVIRYMGQYLTKIRYGPEQSGLYCLKKTK
jgi:hypothetical protein